jgi:hypothetical protein
MPPHISHTELHWRKSLFCAGGSCVEVAPLDDGGVALRNSNMPAAEPVVVTGMEWSDFVAGMKAGHFDGLHS